MEDVGGREEGRQRGAVPQGQAGTCSGTHCPALAELELVTAP